MRTPFACSVVVAVVCCKVDVPPSSTYTSTTSTLCIYLYANENRATPFSARHRNDRRSFYLGAIQECLSVCVLSFLTSCKLHFTANRPFSSRRSLLVGSWQAAIQWQSQELDTSDRRGACEGVLFFISFSECRCIMYMEKFVPLVGWLFTRADVISRRTTEMFYI